MIRTILLGGLVSLISISEAFSHVVFNVDEAEAGSFHTAQLRVMHGCEGQPTDHVRIVMPDGVTRVRLKKPLGVLCKGIR